MKQGVRKIAIGSSSCPPPRKSLVKGERFVRFEGRPEHDYNWLAAELFYRTNRND